MLSADARLRTVWAVRYLFATLGAVFGSWAIRIPDIARASGLDSSELGVALCLLAVGSLVGMPASGWLLARLSLRSAATALSALLAVVAVVVATSGGPTQLFVAVLLFGLANGVYGVIINTAATQLEHTSGESLLPGCHAAFSVATVVAALAGSAAVGMGVPAALHMSVVALAVGVPALWLSRFVDGVHRAGRYRYPRPRSPLVWVASGVAFTALFAEGAVTDWSAYFLQHEILGGSDARQAWGYSCFAVSMAAGRAAGATLINRFGERRLLMACIALALFGYAVVVTSSTLPVCLGGFACIGLGLSNLYPVMISMAARRIEPQMKQDAVASVSSIGYFGFLLGPAVIGALSGALTIRGSLAGCVLVLLFGAAGIYAILRSDRPSLVPCTQPHSR